MKNKLPVPSTYRCQNGCWNCKKVFAETYCGDRPLYYCHQDKSIRPASSSYEAWDKWNVDREVDPIGICDEWVEE